jgi:hypothetical protein
MTKSHLPNAMSVRVLKTVMWIYLSLGVLIILAIAFELFVMPLISQDGGASTDSLDLMEKILLGWGIILLPFLKIGQMYVKKHQREKNAPR